jgi:glutamyl-tRNA synthetase
MATLPGIRAAAGMGARAVSLAQRKAAEADKAKAAEAAKKAKSSAAGPKLAEKAPELEFAEMGKVVTRFPPEPSGYLHIGHAKACLLNHYFARRYNGKLVFRFDDTNPSKESVEFCDSIREDLKTLGVTYDIFSHTSDHFPLMLEKAYQLIRDGKAFADASPREVMSELRAARLPSPYRDQPVEETLRCFAEMQAASEEGQRYCLRAKINYEDPNGALRDPVIYRVNLTPHHRTGTTYKVYPSYDFACPIVDSIEGVTHALRTSEFLDRNPQYWWVCDALGIRKPRIYDFSRLNLQYTVLSKRKLQWFVDTGRVTGWNDPRFPTVRGMRRRGLTVEALTAFVLSQGASRSVNLQSWNALWAANRQVIDPVAPRYTGIGTDTAPVTITVTNAEEATLEVPLHRKNPAVGSKQVHIGPNVVIDAADAGELVEGAKVTLMNWGNILVKSVTKDASGAVTAATAEFLPADKDFAKTAKITWLACPATSRVPLLMRSFGHLTTKPSLDESDNFEDYVNEDTIFESHGFGQAAMTAVKVGDIIQLERRGFYYCDAKEGDTLVLHFIPDGKDRQGQVLGR